MSPAWGHAVGVFTVLLMSAFIGVWAWAWLPRHRGTFGRLSRLPMEDRAALAGDPIPPTDTEERR
jgi:cytochrome c oxidase cbb3-type subunit 4